MSAKKSAIPLSLLVLFAGVIYINFVHGTTAVPLKRKFLFFPFEINGWRDKEKAGSDYLAGTLGADDMLVREYENKDGQKLELYFSYFEYTKEKKTPHAPQLCWVGSGWAFKDLGQERISSGCAGCPQAMIGKVLAEKDGNKILLIYCYRTNRSYTSDLLKFKMISAIDAFFRRKNNAFTMQLSIPLGEGDLEQKEALMKEFLGRVFNVLETEYFK